MELWFELLSQAQKSRYRLILTSTAESYLPKGFGKVIESTTMSMPSSNSITISNNPELIARDKQTKNPELMIISINDLLSARDLFLGGKIAQWLLEGKKVVLYANDFLDDQGDLQQLLTTILQGKLVGPNGEYENIPPEGKFELFIASKDLDTRRYFSWIHQPVIHIESNFDAGCVVFKEKNTKKEQEQAESIIAAALPDLQSQDWALSDENISPERKAAITHLWQFLQTIQDQTNQLSSVLIEGPSALSKTSLTKQLLRNMGYRLIEEDNLTCNEKNTCFVFKFSEKRLPEYLAHAMKYGQILLIDEINSLSPASQQLIIHALIQQEQDKAFNGFGIIGTLNQGYYPGRESCLAELKELSQHIQLKAYNPEETTAIFKQKIQTTQIDESKTKTLPAELVEGIVEKLLPRIPNNDAIVRLFMKGIMTLKPKLAQLYIAWFSAECAKRNPHQFKENSLFVERDGFAEIMEVTDDTDLTNIKLSSEDFERLYAAGVRNFRNADLRDIKLHKQEISGADFSGANLSGVSFEDVIITQDLILTNSSLDPEQLLQLFKAGKRTFNRSISSSVSFEELMGCNFDANLIFDFLLHFYSDVNVVDTAGLTPLMMALQFDKKDLVIRLIDDGADVHTSDAQGKTILQYAKDTHEFVKLYQEIILFPQLKKAIASADLAGLKNLWENRLIDTNTTEALASTAKTRNSHLGALIAVLELKKTHSSEKKLELMTYIVEQSLDIEFNISSSENHTSNLSNGDTFNQLLFENDDVAIFDYLEKQKYFDSTYKQNPIFCKRIPYSNYLTFAINYNAINIIKHWIQGSVISLKQLKKATINDDLLKEVILELSIAKKSVFQKYATIQESHPASYQIIHEQYQKN